MRHVLARAHRPVLEQVAWSRVLLDFDGTPAPAARREEEAP